MMCYNNDIDRLYAAGLLTDDEVKSLTMEHKISFLKPYEIYQGDCMEIMKGIPDRSVDLVLCDPPYGVLSKCDWDIPLSWDDLWLEYERVCKPGGVIAIFGTEPFASMVRVGNLKRYRYDWIWKKTLPVGWMRSNYEPLRDYECIMVFRTSDIKTDRSQYYMEIKDYMIAEKEKMLDAGYVITEVLGNFMGKHYFTRHPQFSFPKEEDYKKLQRTGFFQRPYAELKKLYKDERKRWKADKTITYHPQMGEGVPYKAGAHSVSGGIYGSVSVPTIENDGSRHPRQVLEFPSDKEKYHPTQKPVALLEYLIKTYTDPGEVVLDNTAGSGSTGVAAINSGRRFIGIEIDPAYYEIMKNRLEER